jgi:hypothetical protein
MKYKILEEMKEMVGKKEPILFFSKMVDVFSLLFDKIDNLEKEVKKNNNLVTKSDSLKKALSISWDPLIAGMLLVEEVEKLKNYKDLYKDEISAFKNAYNLNIVTQDYDSFVKFWKETIGEHPFADNS